MENKTSTTCKIVALVSFLICIIGGIILGNIFALHSPYSYKPTFNFGLMIGIWVSGFFSALFFYILGEIIEQLIAVNANVCEVRDQIRALRKTFEEPKVPSPVPPSVPSAQPAPKVSHAGSWVCKKCGRLNSADNRFCKDCGTYK